MHLIKDEKLAYGHKVLFAEYLRNDFVKRSLKIIYDNQGEIESLFFNSTTFGTATWNRGEGLEAHRWESEDEAQESTFLTRNFPIILQNGIVNDDLAQEKIVNDVLGKLEDKELLNKIRKLLES